MAEREYIYLVTDEIQLTPICEDCGPNLVPVMRKEELIRCKDCKWIWTERCPDVTNRIDYDGFCSWGEREDNE